MSAPRFYIPQLSQVSYGALEPSEARHATAVLRMRADDRLVLFDGQGGEALARVVTAARGQLEFEVLERIDSDRELPQRLSLAIALPKGDRQRTLVDAATELGVARLIPLRTARGVAQPTDNALERLQRSVIEASKQCRRNRLMAIDPPQSLEQLAEANESGLRLVAHPYEDAGPPEPLVQALRGPAGPVTVAIGPEGGFTAAEVQQLVARQWLPVSLGPTILRVEIAAIAAIAQVAGWLHQAAATQADGGAK